MIEVWKTRSDFTPLVCQETKLSWRWVQTDWGGEGGRGGATPPQKKQNTHPLSNFCFYMLWCKWTCKQQETMPGTQLNWLFDSLLPASILSHCVQVKKEKRKKKPQTNQCRGLARACTWLIDLHTWIRPGARGGDSRQSPPLIWTSRD